MSSVEFVNIVIGMIEVLRCVSSVESITIAVCMIDVVRCARYVESFKYNSVHGGVHMKETHEHINGGSWTRALDEANLLNHST